MSVKLPKLIDTYIKAQNAYDADTALAAFLKMQRFSTKVRHTEERKPFASGWRKSKRNIALNFGPSVSKKPRKRPL